MIIGHGDVVLRLDAIDKRFGNTVALDQATLTVRSGTIHALLGENGAGKTTLMHIAFGMTAPDAGTMTVHGQPRRFRSPSDAITQGLGMVHQHFMLVPAMTVAENIALGGRGRLSMTRTARHIEEVSRRYGLPIDPAAVVSTLPVGAQQRVEILKALAHDATILILDEPTAVLTAQESRELLSQLRHFVAQGGTVVWITHKLRDALEFADEVTVLRRGRTVLTSPATQVTESTLANAMLGTPWDLAQQSAMLGEPNASASTDTGTSDETRPAAGFTLQDVVYDDDRGVRQLDHVTLAVAGGEILGIAAVEGNGQQALLRIAAGRLRPTAGRVQMPAEVGFVPEDRHRDAVILEYTLTENNALAGLGTQRGVIAWGRSRTQTEEIVRDYDVRTLGTESAVRTLSGGNQQKFVVGRELRIGHQALVLENPTRGLDIQATADVHRHIRIARESGIAIVLYSSDLDEVLALADRVAVLYGGQLSVPVRDRDIIGRAMLGAD